jgi:hypothetical protein
MDCPQKLGSDERGEYSNPYLGKNDMDGAASAAIACLEAPLQRPSCFRRCGFTSRTRFARQKQMDERIAQLRARPDVHGVHSAGATPARLRVER